MSALPPIATAKADMPQMVMSALPPKADVCSALAEADIRDADVAAGPTERFFLRGTAVAGKSILLIDPERRVHQTGCRQDVTDAPH
jgi:hypothetical protein